MTTQRPERSATTGAAGEWRVRVIHDADAESPREANENLGVLVCFPHRRYRLGDRTPTEEEFQALRFGGWSGLERHCRRRYGATCLVPVGLYDHSGLHLYVGSGPYRYDPQGWDSGAAGWLMDTAETRERLGVEPGVVTVPAQEAGLRGRGPVQVDRIRLGLTQEVETYDQYLRGDIWGFFLERYDGCEHCGRGDWHVEDGCWGFYGLDPDNGMAEHLPEEHRPLLEEALRSPGYGR